MTGESRAMSSPRRPNGSGPGARDPLVVDGTKYRIQSIDLGVVKARQHFAPNATVVVGIEQLRWDHIAGVWRVVA